MLVWNILFTVFKINHHTRSKTFYRIFVSFFFIIHLSPSFPNGLINPTLNKHQSYKFSLIFYYPPIILIFWSWDLKKATSKRPDTFQITSRKKREEKKRDYCWFLLWRPWGSYERKNESARDCDRDGSCHLSVFYSDKAWSVLFLVLRSSTYLFVKVWLFSRKIKYQGRIS